MSVYSLDSLESVKDDSLEKQISFNSGNNLGTIKSDDRSIQNASLQLNSVLTSSQIKGIKHNKLNSYTILEKEKIRKKKI